MKATELMSGVELALVCCVVGTPGPCVTWAASVLAGYDSCESGCKSTLARNKPVKCSPLALLPSLDTCLTLSDTVVHFA